MSPAPDGTSTWRELLGDAVRQLEAAGSTSAGADARRILAEVMGVEPVELALHLSAPATEGAVARLDAMVARRRAGEPLQYVLGSWGFRSLDLMVDRRVLIPRPETEQVVEVALAELDRLGGAEQETIVVDLGTGSGCVGLSIAVERVRAQLWLVEADTDALAVASANVVGVGRPGASVRLLHGDWFAPLPEELTGRVELIVSNPPYVPDAAVLPAEVAEWEPIGALRSGVDGADDLRHIVEGAPRWLRDGGAVVCELSPEQGEPMAELAGAHFEQVELAADLTGRTRALIARVPRR